MRPPSGAAFAIAPFLTSEEGVRVGASGPLRRFLLDRRHLLVLLAIVAAFSLPIAAVIGYAADRRSIGDADGALQKASLAVLGRARILERRLRELRAHAVVNHRISIDDRASVERGLIRLEDATTFAAGGAVRSRLRSLDGAWRSVTDRRRSLHDVDSTIAAIGNFEEAVAQRGLLSSSFDEAAVDAIDVLTDVLPTIDDRLDQTRNIVAGALVAKRFPPSTRFAVDILGSQETRAYETAIHVAERVRAQTGNAELLGAVRRLGFADSRFEAAVAFAVSRRVHTRTDRTRVARRADEVARNIDAAAAGASAVAAAGYERTARYRRRAFENTRNLALLAWLAGVSLAAVSTYAVYRRERNARRTLYGNVVERLALSQAQLEAIFENSPYGVAIFEAGGAIVRRNAAFTAQLRTTDLETMLHDPRFAELFEGTRRGFTIETKIDHGDHADWISCEYNAVTLAEARTAFVLAFSRDVTKRRNAEMKLRYETNHDPISRLPNRTSFLEHMKRALADDPGQCRAVAFLDVRAEDVAGTLGYTGDDVFAAIATRLASCVEPNDFIARFDGSTFVVLLYGAHDRASARRSVEKWFQRLLPPVAIGAREVHLRAWAGIALTDRPYREALDVLRDAESAMFDARGAGIACAIFVPDMRDRAARRLALVSQLRRAIERDQFHLAFQPLIASQTQDLCGFEALLRWEHPELGNIPPDEFIALAEEVGTIGAIGRFVLDRACAQLATWYATSIVPVGDCKMAINVSVRELLADDYPAYVSRTLARHALAASDIVLEVTESAILFDDGAASEALARLKAIGVEFAIDDFGTGYSSLRYLHDFPFHELKIDGSFVRGAGDGLAAPPIVAMLVTLAKSLGVTIVAEGVETNMQATQLTELGVDVLQGYYYGRPMAAALIPEYVRGRATHARN